MAQIKPRTLSGFMELLPARQVQFDRMVEILRKSYSLYGFTPLDTPAIEAAEVLLAKGGGETEKQIYRFTKGDSDLALRFDLTVPLAKYVALHQNELTFPFRRFQISKVYRGERAQKGRYREFYQADIDVIGDGSLDITNEAEIPSIIYKTFTALGLRRFKIRVNNRKVLNGLFAILGLEKQAGDVMRTIDKLEKIGPEKVRAILTDDFAVPGGAADALLALLAAGDPMAALEPFKGKNELFDLGVAELETVVRYMSAFGVPEEHFTVDLTIARGLDYYTGTVYETVMLDHPEVGSICSGGRYDNLAEYYTDKQLPGVGISIGLTRLFSVLEAQGYLNDALVTAPAAVNSGGRADPPHDRRALPRHLLRHRPAGRGGARPAPLREEKVQAEAVLCGQAVHPLRRLPGGGRDSAEQGDGKGSDHRAAADRDGRGGRGPGAGRAGGPGGRYSHPRAGGLMELSPHVPV